MPKRTFYLHRICPKRPNCFWCDRHQQWVTSKILGQDVSIRPLFCSDGNTGSDTQQRLVFIGAELLKGVCGGRSRPLDCMSPIVPVL